VCLVHGFREPGQQLLQRVSGGVSSSGLDSLKSNIEDITCVLVLVLVSWTAKREITTLVNTRTEAPPLALATHPSLR
jgi:hypothetical protein